MLLIMMIFSSIGGFTLPTIEAEVDLIEYNEIIPENHKMIDDGRTQFRQLIFYEYNEQRQFVVRQYFLLGNKEFIFPEKNGEYYIVHILPEFCKTKLVKIKSKFVRKTRTFHDPERENQKILEHFLREPIWQ